MSKEVRVELVRDSDAVDLERFVAELGLHPVRFGRTVATRDDTDSIDDAVTAWLAVWATPLVPTTLPDGALALRPPAA